MTVSRNDACPCGSGLKYKKCCLPKDAVAAASGAGEADSAPVLSASRLPYYAAAIAIGVAAGFWRGPAAGFTAAAGVAMVVVVYFAVRNPPPPRPDSGNPAALDFGLRADEKTKKRDRTRRAG